MRKNMIFHHEEEDTEYKIMVLDDEQGILDSLSVFLAPFGYNITGYTNPLEAIERMKQEHFDMLILDFMMDPIHGDEVVEKVREFDKDIYILLLTGHASLVPPLETIKRLDIQGYCEKSGSWDQLVLLVESGIKSIKQFYTIKTINAELKNKSEELEKAYLETIGILRHTVEAKDPYTRGHSDRVSEYSVLLGKELGLDEDNLHTLKIGGLFHDIGKIGIPDSILLKESKLSDDEYSQIKNHPSIGEHMLGDTSIFRDIIPIVKRHHERFDGKGYPGQLCGCEIPFLARITAVVDTFDAMTSKRSYRDALPIDVVISEIEKCSGTQFDPEVAEAFLRILRNKYNLIEEIQKKYN